MKKVKAVLLRADGTASRIEIKSGEDINKAVGGWLEVINFQGNVFVYINEEGKLLGLPLNNRATGLAYSRNIGLIPGDVIVGNVVFVGPADNDGNDTDVPEDFARELLGE
jgi:hypothetical protein